MAEKPKKKVVRVESKPKASPARSGTASSGSGTEKKDGKAAPEERVWTPTPESKSKATRLRIVSWGLWILAIALEIFAIFWILRQDPINMWLLVGSLVVIGAFALGGNLLWKQANRLDPASKKDSTKFFIQNQLGAFMTMLAFLPLIIMVLLDKNMDGKQKAVAGGVGAILALVIALTSGVSWDGGPSQEQYAEEENIVMQLTGEDLVFWTKSGKVFHVCEDVPDLQRESKDATIYSGTVADAHENGKDRITKRWESEALICGYTQADVDRVRASLEGVPQVPSTNKEGDETKTPQS